MYALAYSGNKESNAGLVSQSCNRLNNKFNSLSSGGFTSRDGTLTLCEEDVEATTVAEELAKSSIFLFLL